jgi:hypothetical protein
MAHIRDVPDFKSLEEVEAHYYEEHLDSIYNKKYEIYK